MTLLEKIEELKQERSNALNSKILIEAALLEAETTDELNDSYLFSEDINNPGVQDIYRLYLLEKQMEDGSFWQYPVLNEEIDAYTKAGWDLVLRASLHELGDGSDGLYPIDTATDEILNTLAKDAFTIDLTKQTYTYSADITGTIDDFTVGESILKVYYGSVELICDFLSTVTPTTNNTYRVTNISITPASAIILTNYINANDNYVIAPTAFSGTYADITLTIKARIANELYTFTRVISYVKYVPGADVEGLTINSTSNSFFIPTVEGPYPDVITLTAIRNNIDESNDISWAVVEGAAILRDAYTSGNIINTLTYTGDTVYIYASDIDDASTPFSDYVVIEAYVDGILTTITGQIGLYKVYQGASGINAFSTSFSQELYTFKSLEDGTIVEDYNNAANTVSVYYGEEELQANSVELLSGNPSVDKYGIVSIIVVEGSITLTPTIVSNQIVFTPSNFATDSATISVTLKVNGNSRIYTFTKNLVFKKSKFSYQMYDAKYINFLEPLDTEKGSYISSANQGIFFTASNTLRIISFSVYADIASPAAATINLYKDSLLYKTYSVTLVDGHNRIVINEQLLADTYKLEIEEAISLWHNSTNINYPYDKSAISFTGSTTSNKYYYFYDFLISSSSFIDAPLIVDKGRWEELVDGLYLFIGDIVINGGKRYVCTQGHIKSEATEPPSDYWIISSDETKYYEYIYLRSINQPTVPADTSSALGDWQTEAYAWQTGDDPEEILWVSQALRTETIYISSNWSTPIPYEGEKAKTLHFSYSSQDFVENSFGEIVPNYIDINIVTDNFAITNYNTGITWTITGYQSDGTEIPLLDSNISLPSGNSVGLIRIAKDVYIDNDVVSVKILGETTTSSGLDLSDVITIKKITDADYVKAEFSVDGTTDWTEQYKIDTYSYIRLIEEGSSPGDSYGFGLNEDETIRAFIFKRGNTKPALDRTVDNPIGWVSSPAAYDGKRLWMSYAVKDGSGSLNTGERWSNPISLRLFEEIQVVFIGRNRSINCLSTGEPIIPSGTPYSGKTSTISVYSGFNKLQFITSETPSDGEFTVTPTVSPEDKITLDISVSGSDCLITAQDFDSATDEIDVSYSVNIGINGEIIERTEITTYDKVKNGEPAKVVRITPSVGVFSLNKNEDATPAEIILTAAKQNIDNNLIWSVVEYDLVEGDLDYLIKDLDTPSNLQKKIIYADLLTEELENITVEASFGDFLATSSIQVLHDGLDGYNQGTLTAYKRSETEPSDTPGTITYTFSPPGWTPLNSWSKTIPSGEDPLYSVSATVYSKTNTDVVDSSEWSSPELILSPALKTAAVKIFQRTSTNVAPSVPSGTITFTFSTSSSDVADPWYDNVPSGSGDYVWTTFAAASSIYDTDTILTGEWAEPVLYSTSGTSVRELTIFKRSESDINSTPTGGSYDFSTQVLTPPSGWSNGIPTGSVPVWESRSIVTTVGTSGTATPIWQIPVKVFKDGEGWIVVVTSSNGSIFKPGESMSTTLSARVFVNGEEVTSTLSSSLFRWERVSYYANDPVRDPSGSLAAADAAWNIVHQNGYKTILVSSNDVLARATFFCYIISL